MKRGPKQSSRQPRPKVARKAPAQGSRRSSRTAPASDPMNDRAQPEEDEHAEPLLRPRPGSAVKAHSRSSPATSGDVAFTPHDLGSDKGDLLTDLPSRGGKPKGRSATPAVLDLAPTPAADDHEEEEENEEEDPGVPHRKRLRQTQVQSPPSPTSTSSVDLFDGPEDLFQDDSTESSGDSSESEDSDREDRSATSVPTSSLAATVRVSMEDTESDLATNVPKKAGRRKGPGPSLGAAPSAQIPRRSRVQESPTKSVVPVPAISPLPANRRRVHLSPTKALSRPSLVAGQPETAETLYILGTSLRVGSMSVLAYDSSLAPHNIHIWNAGSRNEFVSGTELLHVTVKNLKQPVSNAQYGAQRTVTGNVTVAPAPASSKFDLQPLLLSTPKSPAYEPPDGSAYVAFFEMETAEVSDRSPAQSRAPNLRATVYGDGVAADVVGWVTPDQAKWLQEHVPSQRDKSVKVGRRVYVLGSFIRMASRQLNYYELKLHGCSCFKLGKFWNDQFPELLQQFVRAKNARVGLFRDDCFPKITVFKALAALSLSLEHQQGAKTEYIVSTFVVTDTGGALTLPLCNRPDCSIQCNFNSAEGPFTCVDHGEVEPDIVSRPTATILLKTSDNRHTHTDKDTTVECTIGAGQEAAYLGMTLEDLDKEDDVDLIRVGQVGKRFRCTLAISKNNIAAINLKRL
jgi:hypothetical protein